jgi:hypothetical protein
MKALSAFMVMVTVLSCNAVQVQAATGDFPYHLAQGHYTLTDDPADPNVHYKNYDTGLQVTCFDYGVITYVNAGSATFDSFTLQDFQMMPAKELPMVSYPVDYSLCRAEYIAYANEVMALLPANVLQMLSERGVSIHVISESQKASVEGFTSDSVAGFYNTVTTTRTTKKGNRVTRKVENTVRTIYVLDDAWTAIAHETGHAIDDDLGNLSSTDGFKAVYQAYGDKFGSYAQSSPKEFFAELYLQYLCNGTRLNQYYPQLYQYMAAVTAMVS